MRSILLLCVQDYKRLLSNALFWVMTATLAFVILVINFALPEELSVSSHRFVTLNVEDGENFGEAAVSEEALRDAVRNGGVIGLMVEEKGLTVVHPNLSEKNLNAVLLSLSGTIPAEIEVKQIGEGSKAIPFNKRTTPIFIAFEALITGFILGGALMLAEKEDGTLRALRVAPMSAFRYLMAKTLLFSLIGTVYATLICLFSVGFAIAWIPFLLLAFFGTATTTLLGLAYTTLFRDMSGWFFSMTVLLTINMLPVISYSSPTFTPFWLKLIPSYPILFSLEKALFGGNFDLFNVVGWVAAWCVIAYTMAHLMVNKLLLKGARG